MLVLGITIALHLFIPVTLLWWQWRGIEQSRAAWVIRSATVGAYMMLLLLAGLWIAVPQLLGYVYLLVWIVGAIRQYRLIGSGLGPPTGRYRLAIYGIAAGLFIAAAVYAAMGHRPLQTQAVDLAFPLRNGTYSVVSGGGNALMNFHFMTLAKQYERFRGQSYAVDLVKLNRYGTRSAAWLPDELTDYETFDVAVYAPCTGTVARAENTRPDLVPPKRDRVNLPGNVVAIECQGVRVVLAHFKRGSITVEAGQRVSEGQLLGRVGNSGNTDEPHLHIHAERPSDRANPLDAEPVAMRFEGNFLARNDRVKR